MSRYFQWGLVLILAVSLGACQSYSKYAIDGKALLRTDDRLLGIWKAVEDTNKADYFVIQTNDDLYRSIQRYFAEHPPGTDTTLSRKEAEDMLVGSYKERRDKDGYYYYITRMDQNGTNPHFQQWASFLSRINGATFINIPYRHTPEVDGQFVEGQTVKGYFFVRILSITEGGNAMAIAVVKDPALRWLESPAEVRSRIASKMGQPAYYSDTLHLYKVSDYHFSLNDSKAIANPSWKKR